ncbi:MAG: PKD domain-containing protein, partial [Bdellovibrionota bacterium]
MKIEGAAGASAGEDLSYKLNQDLGCSPNQKVSWETSGAESSEAAGSSLVSNFSAAGSYVVTALISSGGTEKDLHQKTVIVADKPGINGPEIVTIGQNASFSIVLPNGYSLASAMWNFGDGTPAQSSSAPVSHVYNKVGLFSVVLTTVNSVGLVSTINHDVNVIDFYDGLECITETTFSSPVDAVIGVPVDVAAYIPSCLTAAVTSVNWNFGDGGVGTSPSASHTYTATGNYTIQLQIFTRYSGEAFLTLTRDVQVGNALPEVPPPNPSPVPSPTPHPSSCSTEGETRESFDGDEYNQEVACGIDGKKKQVFIVKLVEACRVVENDLRWIEVSRTPVLQSESTCMGQSCQLSDGSKLKDGESRTFYSTQTPAGQCSSVSETRTCSNGTLSGSSTYSQVTCKKSCEGFGPHGTVRTGVVTGEESVALVCSFGEQGYFDIFTQLSDQTCNDGSVVGSNTRRGTIKTAGTCPTYSWSATEQYSTWSAACGGTQNRIYVCRNDKGEIAPNDRCTSPAPQQSRVCDGDPDSVARIDRVVTEQEGGSTTLKCPANQIGVIVQTRTATSIKSYACVDHSVKLTSEKTEFSAWVTESYCRDYVAYRCSNDSLDNTGAKGRYDWMVKCQNEVPAIKEFLAVFEDVSAKGGFSVDEGSRRLYPTFMNRATSPEKTWIAPKKSSGSCDVPNTAYVAAVCVSSCSTPEQGIIAQAKANLKLKSVPFIEALLQNYEFVGTLKSQSKITAMDIQKTKV